VWRASGVGEKEVEQRGLCPVAVVTAGVVGLGEEGAVAAARGFEEADERVGDERGQRLRRDGDEGIVERVDDERRHADAVHDANGGGAIVVVVGRGKAGVERRDALVVLAQRRAGIAGRREPGIVRAREETGLEQEAP